MFGVEPICRVLTEHGLPIAPSTYYDAVSRAPSPRACGDEQLKAAIGRVHAGQLRRLRGPQGLAAAEPGGHARWPGARWSG